jgi:hypothetical protein
MPTIATEKVCAVVVMARTYQAKVPPLENGPTANAMDEGDRAVLEAFGDDATYQEAKAFIDAMDIDEQSELIALVLIGRGSYDLEEWEDAVTEARDERAGRAAEYLLATPMVADFLEEGLSKFGESCQRFEARHL